MKKILIVDDEFLSCNALRSIIDWNRYGFNICAEAYNGREALDIISKHNPEIAFIDVSMPIMGGVELLNEIKKNYSEIACIMLSSYSDYDYVREALKLGAVDYLLKHKLDEKEVLHVLELATGEKIFQKTVPSPAQSAESVVSSFLMGNTANLGEIYTDAYKRGIPVAVCIPIQDNSADDDTERILATCRHIIHDRNALLCRLQPGEMAFIFFAEFKESSEQAIKRVHCHMSVIKDAVIKYHSVHIQYSVGEIYSSPDKLLKKYKLAKTSLRSTQTFIEETITGSLSIEQEIALLSAVYDGNYENIKRLLTKLYSPFTGDSGHKPAMSLFTGDVLSMLFKLQSRIGASECEQIPFEAAQDKRKLVECLANAFYKVAEYYKTNDYYKYSDIINKALEYLTQNFSKDIGLKDVASHCNMNPSYLSHLFKKETGIGIINYLNNLRIMRAMGLMLLEDMPATSAFLQAGFNNYNNFFNIFKTITGINPTAFKKDRGNVMWLLEFNPLSGTHA